MSIIGGIGLGLALTYLLGVVLAFVPGWEDWAEFFVPRALWLLIPPYVLLVVHLVLRNHVGRHLLNHGDYEAAWDYSESRMEPSLARSGREVANHRLIGVRAKVGMGEYEEALELLEGQRGEYPGAYAVEARRWEMEIRLRRDEREEAELVAVTKDEDLGRSRGELAALFGCTAELALRNGDENGYREAMRDGMWIQADHPRLGWVRALATMALEEEEASPAMMATLGLLEDRLVREIPGRKGEFQALRANLMWQQGDKQAARDYLKEARESASDEWSDRELERVEEALEELI